jgi:hypothetical protein
MRYFLFNRIRGLFLFGVIGFIIFYLFFDQLSLTDNQDVTVNTKNALTLAEKHLNSFGYSVENYHVEYTYFPDDATRWYLNKINGFQQSRKILREHRVVGDGLRIRFHQNLPRDAPQESFDVTIAPNGELIRWMHNLPASASGAELPDSAASKIAQKFVIEHKILNPADYQTEISSVRLKSRVDHTVRFLRPDSLLHGEMQYQIIVRGNRVEGFARNFIVPPEHSAEFQAQTNFKNQFADFMLPIFILIFIWLIIEFSRLYRNGEIGQRNGLYLLFFSFLLLLFQSLNELTGEAFGWTLYVKTRSQVQFTWAMQKIFNEDVILSLIVFFAFLVGESLLRIQKKSKKLVSTDSIFENEWLTTNVAQSMAQGFFSGGILLGGFTLLGLVFTHGFNAFFSQNLLTGNFDMVFPWLTPILVSARFTMKTVLVSLVFLTTISQKYIKLKIVSVIPFLLVLISTGVLEISFFPHYFNLIFEIVIGLVLVTIFFKYDVLTTVMAYLVMGTLLLAYPLLGTNNGFLVLSGLSATIVGFTPLFNAFLGFKTRRPFQRKAEAVPAYIKQITERERLARELDIARNIQLQLLPQHLPQNSAFDISGLCLPAREVGGDYFDFVTFNDHQIGLGIGDVSGKGIPAAIYMTLTKGIFLSACNENTSPAVVLNQVNKLLYRIMDRGHFVTMFFGIFDTQKLTLTFARAGHNPGIWFQAQNQRIESLELGGLALGLDSGTIFENTLREETVQLSPGDSLVFYTDGFSEARNAEWEEFGEHRLIQSLTRNQYLPAKNIIQNIMFELNTFIQGQVQQDDMTMVVVKVNRNGSVSI